MGADSALGGDGVRLGRMHHRRQPPGQAASPADLRAKLAVASGGVLFNTIQKFPPEEKGDRHPLLFERRNIVVIAKMRTAANTTPSTATPDRCDA